MAEYRSGFFPVVGRPNVGKSTLVNAIIGQKVTITSARPQTTRNRVQGVLTLENAQIIFLDTPGILKPKDKMGQYLARVTLNTLKEVDGIIFVVDGQFSPGPGDRYIAGKLQEVTTPVIIVINKVDKIEEGALENLKIEYSQLLPRAPVAMISALHGRNLGDFLQLVKKYLPVGPQYFPADMVTDQPEQFIVAEIIREKAFKETRDEVPYSLAVEVVDMSLKENKDIVHIYANIYTERESQKGIIVGKKGQMLKRIGTEARQDIEVLLASKVYLELRVKVRKNWRSKEEEMKRLGYR